MRKKSKKKEAAEAAKAKRKAEREAKAAQKKSGAQQKKRRRPASPSSSDHDIEDQVESGESSDDENACVKCKSKSGAAKYWVGCDRCGRWYHKRCVGVSQTLSDQELENLEFVCDICN